MQLLSREDAKTLLELLIDELSRQVLEAVTREGGRREAQLVSEVLRWLPRIVRTEEVRTWVSDVLDWFVARGDVEKGLGGRYHCVPPYLIGDVEDPHCAELSLCGDPRAEPLLWQGLQPLGASLGYETIRLEMEIETENAPIRPIPPVGLERFVSLPPGLRAEVVQACESLGIVIVQPKDLAAALPRLTKVAAPAERDLSVSPMSAGLWEVYEPRTDDDDRWRPDADWRAGQARLIRWRPSDDWRGERSARIFYHAGSGRVAELGSEAASLWQLYLDADAGRPRTIWWDGARLWVPRMLPVATQQWLRVLAGRSPCFRGRWLVLEMNEALTSMACTTLVNTLRLWRQDGRPPATVFRRSYRRSSEQ
ncbi:hypothetical protein HKBW3S47_00115 [Candidatus Hakubella thermalkaliphila]|uniref:Uncharacterized protein n=2 Tax=Candidatus Hakubella thermalkaliphila TaxID=2754717 RepID=A0A6V8Q8B7_9ACTN|nr:hypothetical protein HKBW3S47_00115 [Candidatus Hakubella thermalkaliphila]GFP40958.1 hypothetical protein HKBW3C_00083 [Candidatus Hakubella thermalkaliphila]